MMAAILVSLLIVLTALGLSVQVGWRTTAMTYGIGVQDCAIVFNYTEIREPSIGSVAGSYWPRISPLDMASRAMSGPHWGRRLTTVPMWWVLAPCALLFALSSRLRPRVRRGINVPAFRRKLWLWARGFVLALALGATMAACLAPLGLYMEVGVNIGAASSNLFLYTADQWEAFGRISPMPTDERETIIPWWWADSAWHTFGGWLPRRLTDWDLRAPTWLIPICLLGCYLLLRRFAPKPLRTGQCESCGYDLSGLAAGAVCPECGAGTPSSE